MSVSSRIFIRNFISDKRVKMPPFAKHKPRTHDDSLNLVCAACWRKNKSVRTVSESLADLLRKYVFKDYSMKNSIHPKVICDGCRYTITKLEKVGYLFSLFWLVLCVSLLVIFFYFIPFFL